MTTFRDHVLLWNAEAMLTGTAPVWWKRCAIRFVLGIKHTG